MALNFSIVVSNYRAIFVCASLCDFLALDAILVAAFNHRLSHWMSYRVEVSFLSVF